MEKYIEQTNGSSIQELIQNHHQELIDFYTSLPDELADYAYAEGKWSVKETLVHVVDTDSVFAYRALVIARGEQQALPGFDQDQYAANMNTSEHSFTFWKEAFVAQRRFIEKLITSFSEQQLLKIGSVSDYRLSVNASCYVLFGHALHHMNILKERYLRK